MTQPQDNNGTKSFSKAVRFIKTARFTAGSIVALINENYSGRTDPKIMESVAIAQAA